MAKFTFFDFSNNSLGLLFLKISGFECDKLNKSERGQREAVKQKVSSGSDKNKVHVKVQESEYSHESACLKKPPASAKEKKKKDEQ